MGEGFKHIASPSAAASESRGIILVDTNIFFTLYAAVAGEFRESGKPVPLRRYLDALKFLGEQGYDILIPEMVAYEAGNVVSTGNDVDRYFDKADHKRSKVYRMELKKFLRQVAEGEYEHIKMLPTEKPDDVAQFLQAVHEIVDKHTKPSPQIASKLRRLQRRKTKNFGDFAISALLEDEEGIRSEGKPVFILSDDHGVLRNAAQYPDINVVNTKGFIASLMRSGIWEGFGLRHEATLSEVMLDIIKQKELITGQKAKSHNANVDFTGADYLQYMGQVELPATTLRPFTHSLHELSHDLGWDIVREQPEPQSWLRNTESRADAFRRKYSSWSEKKYDNDNGPDNSMGLAGGR